MEEKNIRRILQRYLLGNAHGEDGNAVDNWYDSFDNERLVPLSEEETAATRQEIWDKVAPVLSEEKKVWTLPSYLKVAAMILVIAGAALLILHHRHGQQDAIAFTTISTGIGEKKKVTAQDGSLLLLNAGTTIRIQNDFSSDRKIELVDGEVFFDVKTDAQRPFTVTSGSLTTTVLGTSFNISAYKELNNLSIGVVDGKVSVAGDSAALSVLLKEEELVFNKTSKTYKKIPLDESLTAWQSGRLVLNDLSFNEMATIMKKNYGIDVVTNDEAIRNTRYTTELSSAMSPLQAIQVLAAIHELKVREKNKQFYLAK
ncbi:FecR domain-containing protein [Flavitalea sp. BT771]|uniref:FecR family protein n=1 Tax=Flavitalea sp. BT771 TaxID=3063329 RepID=UPI0026E411BC|nr:FecR domain-containing protein [Flavitalea sp. BT771]MDO6432924.1 FecR domain-containing protein [Flavitalea sp. BT771]MDV6221800.1 FecR domain-containing protein [Flavitalea sp. BT771]